MSEIVLTLIPTVAIGVCIFALVDAVVRRLKRQFAQHPMSWLGFLGPILLYHPESKLLSFIAGCAIAVPTWYALYRRTQKTQPQLRPEALLLEFCSPSTTAVAGGLSAVFLALSLYCIGFLGDDDYWTKVGVWKLFAFPYVGGAILASVRRRIRLRRPDPVWVPYVFKRRLDGSGVWAEGQGLWMDEVVLPIVITPVLWLGLAEVDLGWSGFFMFGLALPTYGFYFAWTFANRFWLRLVGVIDRAREMQFIAYELLISQQAMARWMGEIAVEWRDGGYVASGILPRRSDVTFLKRSLEQLAESVDVSGVTIVPELQPNPWFQLALIRQKRRNLQRAS